MPSPTKAINLLKTLVFAMGFTMVGWCFAQDHDHGHAPEIVDPDLEAFRNGKPRRMVSVGVFTGLGKTICEELAKDGRAVEFGELIDSFSQKDKDCAACRPLLRTLSVPCLPVKKPSLRKPKRETEEEAEEAPSPTPVPPQHVPSTLVIRAVVDYAFEAPDHEQAGELKKAFKRIEIALRSGQVKSQAAREYFDILLAYLLDPIEKIQDIQGVGDSRTGSEDDGKANRKSVDTLFE